MNSDNLKKWKQIIVEAEGDPIPKKKEAPKANPSQQTKTKQKSPTDDINLNRDEFYPDTAKGDKTQGDVNLSAASPQKSADAMKDIKMDKQSLAYLLSLALNVDEDEIDQDVGMIDFTKPTPNLLPKVISTAMLAAGTVTPEFHPVKQLPGYMSAAIRMLGKGVFLPFTKTSIADIQVIANLNGSGPNSNQELSAVANFLKKNGTMQGWSDDAQILFSELMPGYTARVVVRAFANYTFMIVVDHAGQYVYAWPSTDNKQPVIDKSIDRMKLN